WRSSRTTRSPAARCPRSANSSIETSAALARHHGALLRVHLVPDARSLAEVAVGAALGEVLLPRLRREVLRGLRVADLHVERLLAEVHVVHPDRVVVGEERAHLDADVAADALLEPVLHRLDAPPRHGASRQVLDALDGAELGALAAREAQVDVHE